MARRVLANLDEALESVTSLNKIPRGLVRVAAPETLSCTLLPELIAKIQPAAIPASMSGSTTCRSSRCWRACKNGSTDIGFGPAGVVADELVEAPYDLRRPAMGGVASRRSVGGRRIGQLERFARPADDQLHAQYRHQCAAPRAASASPRGTRAGAPGEHSPGDAEGKTRCRDLSLDGGGVLARLRLTFLPLRQPTVKWRIALFAPPPDITLASGGKLPQLHAGVRPELGGNRIGGGRSRAAERRT